MLSHMDLKVCETVNKLAMIPCAVNWFESIPGQLGFELFCLNLPEVHGLEPNVQDSNYIIFSKKRSA